MHVRQTGHYKFFVSYVCVCVCLLSAHFVCPCNGVVFLSRVSPLLSSDSRNIRSPITLSAVTACCRMQILPTSPHLTFVAVVLLVLLCWKPARTLCHYQPAAATTRLPPVRLCRVIIVAQSINCKWNLPLRRQWMEHSHRLQPQISLNISFMHWLFVVPSWNVEAAVCNKCVFFMIELIST